MRGHNVTHHPRLILNSFLRRTLPMHLNIPQRNQYKYTDKKILQFTYMQLGKNSQLQSTSFPHALNTYKPLSHCWPLTSESTADHKKTRRYCTSRNMYAGNVQNPSVLYVRCRINDSHRGDYVEFCLLG
jgi:hypothetical protein